MRPTAAGWAASLLAAAIVLGTAGCAGTPQERLVAEQRQQALDHLVRGRELKSQGDLVLARDEFLRATRLSPRPAAYYEVANTHYQLGNYGQALHFYDRALELAPDYALARTERDLARLQLDKVDPAPPRETARTNEQTTTVAQVQQNQDDSTPAPEAVEPDTPPTTEAPPERRRPVRSSGSDPFGGIADAIGGLSGTDQAQYGGSADDVDLDEARALLFPELADGAPFDPDEELTLAAEATDGGRFDEAARRYLRLVTEDPSNPAMRLRYAGALARSGRTRRAATEYERAAQLAPDDPIVHFEFGNFHLQSDNSPAAEASFRRALQIDPAFTRAKNNLAALLLRDGRPAQAVALLEEITTETPEFAPAWLNLALARDDAGAPANSTLQALERHLRISAAGPDARTEAWLRDLRTRAAASGNTP